MSTDIDNITCINACVKAGFEPEVVLTTSRPSIALEYLHEHEEYAYMALKTSLGGYSGSTSKVLELIDSPSFNYVIAWRKGERPREHVQKYLDFLLDKTSDEFINASYQRRIDSKM